MGPDDCQRPGFHSQVVVDLYFPGFAIFWFVLGFVCWEMRSGIFMNEVNLRSNTERKDRSSPVLSVRNLRTRFYTYEGELTL
jgi:hypothetical protein